MKARSTRRRAIGVVTAFAVALPLLGAANALASVPAAGAAVPAGVTKALTAPGKVTAWMTAADQARGYQSFLANADLFYALSPIWYEMASAGKTTAYTGAANQVIMAGVKAKNVLLLPTVSNAGDPKRVTAMLATPASITTEVTTLTTLVSANGFDGLDLDFLSLAATDRTKFSAFVGQLAAALHSAGKKLTVDVVAKQAEPGTGSAQAHDYAAIGKVADRVRVQAYNFSSATSAPGFIDPLPWATTTASFAASVIPPAKIELGASLFGYDWVGSVGTVDTYDVIQALIAKYKVTPIWSTGSSEYHFTYAVGKVTHTVFYSDVTEVAGRLALVDKFQLAGAALWRLGGEDVRIWKETRTRWPAPLPVPTPTPTPTPTASSSASAAPSASASAAPSASASAAPSASASAVPVNAPSAGPPPAPVPVGPGTNPSASGAPTTAPATVPTAAPTQAPTTAPSTTPSTGPSTTPSTGPSATPTASPSAGPSTTPSTGPSATPTASSSPTAGPASGLPKFATGKVTAYMPYWNQATSFPEFLANADEYSALEPFWYQMNDAATIVAYAGAVDDTMVARAHAKGVLVLPTVNNNFDPVRITAMLSTPAQITTQVNALTALAQTHSYDGIDIDYESMAASDKTNLSAFFTQLGASLHAANKLLTVDVHPKTSDPGTWSGPQSEDYAAIGKAADRVRIMAYDYSWSTSPAGPIAPLSWMTDVTKFAISQITPGKIDLAMPVYGYDWVGSSATGVLFTDVQALLAKYNVTPFWDTSTSEWNFVYTDAAGAKHTVWYADAATVAARLQLVDTYNLAGVGFWALGGDDPRIWTAIRDHWVSTPAATARKVTAYINANDQARGYSSFLANVDEYYAVSPTWYTMTDATHLTPTSNAAAANIINGAHARGVLVIPTVSNAGDPARVSAMLATPALITAQVNTLVNLVQTNNYDGVDLEYLSMAAADRSGFSSFITQLGLALHQVSKQLTVAVHAKTVEPGSWSGPQAQDWTAIGKAADRVRVLTYDYSWSTSAPGPIAPFGWDDSVAKFASTVIPSTKIELGVATYGYDWTGSTGTAVNYDTVQSLLSRYGVTPVWDTTNQEYHVSYTDPTGAAHVVWYSDETSAKARLALLTTYNLGAVLFNHLGGEDSRIWPDVRAVWPSALAINPRVTAYLMPWDQVRGYNDFAANPSLFSAVTPAWYTMNTDGSLTADKAVDANLVTQVHNKSVKVIPSISNGNDAARMTTMLASDGPRTAQISSIISLVVGNNYDGIDIEYMGMAASDRTNFSIYVRALAQAMHNNNKTLTVTLAPKVSEPGTWSGPQAQDWTAIGLAADRVRIVAYDYAWGTSPAGPTAPLAWVDSVAKFAASVIPSAKVELGMSLYGYDWGPSGGAQTNDDTIMALVQKYSATPVWDSVNAQYHFSYTTSTGDVHQVYYSEGSQVTALAAVVTKYNLTGASLYRLGGEDPGVWSALTAAWNPGLAVNQAPTQ